LNVGDGVKNFRKEKFDSHEDRALISDMPVVFRGALVRNEVLWLEVRASIPIISFLTNLIKTGSRSVRFKDGDEADKKLGSALVTCETTAEANVSFDIGSWVLAGLPPSAEIRSTCSCAAVEACSRNFCQLIQPPSPTQKRALHTIRMHQGSQATQTKSTK
jgi:hypothetical protein